MENAEGRIAVVTGWANPRGIDFAIYAGRWPNSARRWSWPISTARMPEARATDRWAEAVTHPTHISGAIEGCNERTAP